MKRPITRTRAVRVSSWCVAGFCVLLQASGAADVTRGLPGGPAALLVDVRHDLVPLGIYETDATGEGEEDDSAAIQAAIDFVAEQGGGTVIIPPGVYRVAGIDVKPGVHLMGAGRKKTIFRAWSTGTMFRPTGGWMSDFSAYGTPDEQGSGENWKVGTGGVGRGGTGRALHVIGIYGGVDVHIHNVRAMESRYDCLYTRGTRGLRVTNCHFDRAGRNVVSMVGDDEDFVFANSYIGSHWGLYHFDIEPNAGKYVRDGLILNCTFDGRAAGQLNTDTWGSMLIFTGKENCANVTVMACTFLDIKVRVRGVFPDVRFLYNHFDVRNRTFVKVRTNPVGEFENALVRGNTFLVNGEPAELINYGVSFTGRSVFEGNTPEKFNDPRCERPMNGGT